MAETRKVAIVGAGLIGRAWAMNFARASWHAALHDPSPAAPEAASGWRVAYGPAQVGWRSNDEQVRSARQIIEGVGLSVATPEEAREMLSLKGGDRANF